VDEAAVVERFWSLLSHDPDTATLAAMVLPYKAYAGTPREVFMTLDKLAGMWSRAKEVTV
jgi:hypothetical protein